MKGLRKIFLKNYHIIIIYCADIFPLNKNSQLALLPNKDL